MTNRSDEEMARDLNAMVRLDLPSNSQDTEDEPHMSDHQMINELRVQMLELLETKKAAVAAVAATTSTAIATSNTAIDDGRYCWVCFATDEDDKMAAWVQPCKCSGTTKWVHQV